jgi:hypothetical protein
MNSHQLINQTSNSVEWYTPWEIIQCARRLMGTIDLDPFSCYMANNRPEGRIANEYHDSDCNTLDHPWFGNVWMNHPFGRKYNTDCISKIVFEAERRDRVMSWGLCITFASTSEKWFAPLLRYPQFYFTGRINYLDPLTMQPARGVTKGSVLTCFPPKGESYEYGKAALALAFGGMFRGVAK